MQKALSAFGERNTYIVWQSAPVLSRPVNASDQLLHALGPQTSLKGQTEFKDAGMAIPYSQGHISLLQGREVDWRDGQVTTGVHTENVGNRTILPPLSEKPRTIVDFGSNQRICTFHVSDVRKTKGFLLEAACKSNPAQNHANSLSGTCLMIDPQT